METQKCSTCPDTFPLTEEFWHCSKKNKTGFSFKCRKCTKEFYSRKAQLARKLSRDPDFQTEEFGPFASKAQADRCKSITAPVISIDREI